MGRSFFSLMTMSIASTAAAEEDEWRGDWPTAAAALLRGPAGWAVREPLVPRSLPLSLALSPSPSLRPRIRAFPYPPLLLLPHPPPPLLLLFVALIFFPASPGLPGHCTHLSSATTAAAGETSIYHSSSTASSLSTARQSRREPCERAVVSSQTTPLLNASNLPSRTAREKKSPSPSLSSIANSSPPPTKSTGLYLQRHCYLPQSIFVAS